MVSRQMQVANKQRNTYAEQSSIKLSLECIQFTNPRISKKSGAENLRIVLNVWEITQVNDLSKPLLVQNSLTPFSKDNFFSVEVLNRDWILVEVFVVLLMSLSIIEILKYLKHYQNTFRSTGNKVYPKQLLWINFVSC